MRFQPKKRRSHPVTRVDSTRPGVHTSHMAIRSFRTLGEAVAARRGELGLTQEEFAERGGFTTKTVQRLEKGSDAPRAKTLASIDKACSWIPGSARAVLDGGEPIVSPSRDNREDVDRILWLRETLTAEEFDAYMDGLAARRHAI